ncbi:MAG: hypothetical protein U1F57_03135 [bacterium]
MFRRFFTFFSVSLLAACLVVGCGQKSPSQGETPPSNKSLPATQAIKTSLETPRKSKTVLLEEKKTKASPLEIKKEDSSAPLDAPTPSSSDRPPPTVLYKVPTVPLRYQTNNVQPSADNEVIALKNGAPPLQIGGAGETPLTSQEPVKGSNLLLTSQNNSPPSTAPVHSAATPTPVNPQKAEVQVLNKSSGIPAVSPVVNSGVSVSLKVQPDSGKENATNAQGGKDKGASGTPSGGSNATVSPGAGGGVSSNVGGAGGGTSSVRMMKKEVGPGEVAHNGQGGILGSIPDVGKAGSDRIPYLVSFVGDGAFKDGDVVLPFNPSNAKFSEALLKKVFWNEQKEVDEYRPVEAGKILKMRVVYFEKAPALEARSLSRQDHLYSAMNSLLSLPAGALKDRGFGPAKVWEFPLDPASDPRSEKNISFPNLSIKKGLFVFLLHDPELEFLNLGKEDSDRSRCQLALQKIGPDGAMELSNEDIDCAMKSQLFVRALIFSEPLLIP